MVDVDYNELLKFSEKEVLNTEKKSLRRLTLDKKSSVSCGVVRYGKKIIIKKNPPAWITNYN